MRSSFGFIDYVIIELQHGLNTCHVRSPRYQRPYPARKIAPAQLNDVEQKQVAGLMRVNNAGEVAAQGLYRGQALLARNRQISQSMSAAAEEENEHLNWCQRRLAELNASRSKLDGFWYWGSFSIGALAGALGDRWSLGFVEETEKQVCRHLRRHVLKLPEQDQRSRAILETMQADEMCHAVRAHQAGAAALPQPVKTAMGWVSRIMTWTAYRI